MPQTTAQFLGERPYLDGRIRMFRLSEPLPNHGPSYQNVCLVDGMGGSLGRYITLGAAYERADSSWSPVPCGNWTRGIAYQGDWKWIEAAVARSGFDVVPT